jgi:hypothetical protein
MRKIFFRTLMILFWLFFLQDWVNACINDGYTLINEQVWSSNYKELLLYGLVYMIFFMWIYLVFLLNTINKYKKSNKFTTSDIYNTVYKVIWVFIATLLITFPFEWLGFILLMIIFLTFLLYYITHSIIDLNNKKLAIFTSMLILYIPINMWLIYLLDKFNFNQALVIFIMFLWTIIYWYILLLIPIFETKNIRLRTLWISTVAVLTIILISSL